MTIVVNDANILIDLAKLELLSQFFALNLMCCTTDLVLHELHDHQQEQLAPFISRGQLDVLEIGSDALIEIINITVRSPALSQQDCSAFYQARTLNAVLLTSDGRLRRYAKSNNVDVHGHLWVFDRMVEYGTISSLVAATKLEILNLEINPRLGLPSDECQKRIKTWRT